jgi:hypothetical protein
MRIRHSMQQLLSAARSDDHCRNMVHIDEGVEKFCAGQMGKMNDIVGNLLDSTPDFFPSLQVQLHGFTGGALEDAENGGVGLHSDFGLGGQIGATCCQEKCKKK